MADTDSSVLPKGSDVWYLHRSGAWQQARVTAVDETMLPAFYQIEMLEDGVIRDTERPRLRERLPEQQVQHPKDARDMPGASLPSDTHLQPAAAGNVPAPAHTSGNMSQLLPGYPQNQSQPDFWPVPTPATSWPQQTAPPAPTHYHCQYPYQYPPAQTQAGTAPAALSTTYPYAQAQHGFQPRYQQPAAYWQGHTHWHQVGQQQQAPYSGYMGAPSYSHGHPGFQQQGHPHQPQYQSTQQHGQPLAPYQYGAMHGQQLQAPGQVPQGSLPGHVAQPGMQPGWYQPSQAAKSPAAFSQQAHMASHATQGNPAYAPHTNSSVNPMYGGPPRPGV